MKRILFISVFCFQLSAFSQPGFGPDDLAILKPAAASGAITAVRDIPDLIAYWDLDEASGNSRADSTANGYTMTESAATASGAGKINNAAGSFSGSGFLQNSAAAFNFASSDFTICGWVNLSSLAQTAFPAMLSKHSPTTDDVDGAWIIFFNDTANTVSFVTYTAASGGTTGPSVLWGSALSISTWYWFCAWREGDTINLSINNGTAVSTAFTGAMYDSTATTKIGTRKSGSDRLNGLVDEVAVFDRALTSTERTAIYNSGSGLAY